MMDREDLVSLVRLVRYGTPKTRQRAAERLLQEGDVGAWSLLASIVRSKGPWRLRARCLEVLGLAAGSADRQQVEGILDLLLRKVEHQE